VTIYSLDILLSQFLSSPLLQVCAGMGTGMVSECAKRKEWKGVEKNEKEK